LTQEEAERWRVEAAETVTGARETFLEKRKSIVRVLWPNGGSPDAENMWVESGQKSPRTVKGKKLFAALKPIAKKNGMDEKLLDAFTIPSNFEVAPDLKAVLEEAVRTSKGSANSNPI
jgi:hypothetical protein